MRVWPILAGAILAAPASSETKDDRIESNGPIYGAAQVRQLSFAEVRLGMTFAEACGKLIVQGYSRRGLDTAPSCDARHVSGEGFDTYFGQGKTSKGRTAESTRSITLHYLSDGERSTVDQISVYTDERHMEGALGRQVSDEWGIPTFDAKWGYRVLTYARSADQADFYHRSDFRSCQVWNGCDTSRSGAKCRHILRRYGTPYATQTIYDWGRHIIIEDGQRWVRHAARSGQLDALRDDKALRACAVPSIH